MGTVGQAGEPIVRVLQPGIVGMHERLQGKIQVP